MRVSGPLGRQGTYAWIGALLLLALSSPIVADELRLLHTARDAAQERVRLVVEARDEVNAAYFIVGRDPFSLTGLSLLRAAARRGLEVRLLVDAQWNKIPTPVQAHLLDEGVQIRQYHPFRVHKPWWVSRRLHDKLLVVDGRSMVAGGRNIEGPYFDLGRQLERRNYIDVDLLLHGQTAADANRYFMTLWESDQVRRSKASASREKLRKAAEMLDGYESWLGEQIAAGAETSAPALSRVSEVDFVHDRVGEKSRAPGVAHALRELMDAAESSLLIESPYLVPSRAFKEALASALARGVRVRVLTNSLGTTDNLFPQAGYAAAKKKLVRSGMELWEYSGPECLHSKVAVIDGRVLVVGSFNLDPRSEHLNTELAMLVHDQRLAGEMLRAMEENLAASVRIDRDGRPEGENRRYEGVSKWKVFKLRALTLVSPLIKKQL